MSPTVLEPCAYVAGLCQRDMTEVVAVVRASVPPIPASWPLMEPSAVMLIVALLPFWMLEVTWNGAEP